MSDQTLYESMYGYPASKPEPAEYALFQKVESEFYEDIEALGAGVVRQLTVLLHDPELLPYLQYAFYILNERGGDWPSMAPKHKAALLLGRTLMQDGLWTPNYDDGLEVPDDPDVDKEVDAALVGLAAWCHNHLRLLVMQKWAVIIGKYGTAFERVQPEATKGDGPEYLNAAIKILARKHPLVLKRAQFLTGIFELIGF